MVTCTKKFGTYPAAHRQHGHSGHCRLIHGHDWAFELTFACDELDSNSFVVDVGDLKWLKAWFENKFDHTLLLNSDDPALDILFSLLEVQHSFADIRVVPNCSMEGLAKYVCDQVNEHLNAHEDYRHRGVRVDKVVVWEDAKNSATYSRQYFTTLAATTTTRDSAVTGALPEVSESVGVTN